jgi:hypothetical protein
MILFFYLRGIYIRGMSALNKQNFTKNLSQYDVDIYILREHTIPFNSVRASFMWSVYKRVQKGVFIPPIRS